MLPSNARSSDSSVFRGYHNTTITESHNTHTLELSKSQKFNKLTRKWQVLVTVDSEARMKASINDIINCKNFRAMEN